MNMPRVDFSQEISWGKPTVLVALFLGYSQDVYAGETTQLFYRTYDLVKAQAEAMSVLAQYPYVLLSVGQATPADINPSGLEKH
jgi:hypothetical protein